MRVDTAVRSGGLILLIDEMNESESFSDLFIYCLKEM